VEPFQLPIEEYPSFPVLIRNLPQQARPVSH
jgi:hypothetical protein